MNISNGKYIRLQKNDPNEQKLLEYLQEKSGDLAVSFDDVGDDAVITLKDADYVPSLDEVLHVEYNP